MDRAVVEFDTLADTDRAGAKDYYRAFALWLHFVFCAIGGVVVRCVGFKFCRAGIYHLEIRVEIQFLLEVFHFFRCLFGEMGDGFIRHLDAFRCFQGFSGEAFLHETAFHENDVLDLVDEEEVDLGDAVDVFRIDAAAQSFGHHENSFVIDAGEEAADIIEGLAIQLFEVQVSFAHFQGAEGFEEGTFQGAIERHDFAGGFHLGADFAICQGEFFEWPSWEFAYHIVDGRFEASFCIFGDGVGDFIQVEAQSDLRCYFGDRVAGGFGCQSRGTADARVYLDDVVLVRLGVQAILYVTAAFDLQVADDVDGSGTEHLVLAVCQGLGRCHDDGVAGVHADGIDIFHGAHDDTVVCTVAHNFEFDFLPAGDASFYQDLVDRRKFDTAVGDFFHFIAVVGDAAAGAAQGVSRTDDDRVADAVSESDGRFQFFENFRFRYRLVDFFHGFLEEFAVFRMLDGMEGRAQELHAVFFQYAGFGELHSHVQAHLAAQGRKECIRSFFLNDFCHERKGDRFDIDAVSDVHVGHDGGGVAVDQDHFYSFFAEGAAGLGACVVEFRSLADDDRAGADDQNFLYICFNHFLNSSMALVNSVKR